MNFRTVIKTAALAGVLATGLINAQSAVAATYVYDFKAAANAGGGIGESIYSTVSATAWPYAARLDGWLKHHGMRSSMPLCGWPSRMARRVVAR